MLSQTPPAFRRTLAVLFTLSLGAVIVAGVAHHDIFSARPSAAAVAAISTEPTTSDPTATPSITLSTTARPLASRPALFAPSPPQQIAAPEPAVCRQTWTYDSEDNVLTHTDRRGITTVDAYDRENRLVSESRAGLMLQSIERDADGNVRRKTDALGRITTFTYDQASRKLSEDRSGLAVERWTYTPLGDVVTYTDSDGRTTTNTYTLRRLLDSESLAGETTRYSYDGAGHRVSRERPNGPGSTWTYGYDDAGNLAAVTDPDGHSATFGHDANNNRTHVTDANGHATTFAYDERNRLAGKTYPGGDIWHWTYDGDGNRARGTAPNGRVTETTYDALNRPTRTDYRDAPPGEVQSTAFTYDGNSNVRTIAETSSAGTRTEARDYDDFDRLTEVTDGDGRTLRYAYDAAGNRTRLTDADGRETVWTYNDLNQNTRVTVPGMGSTSLGYAPSGRVTEISRPDGSLTEQAFFDDGRLQSIRHSKAGQTLARYDYVYDPNGNRTEQRELNGATTADTTQRTRYVYDDADRLVEVQEPNRTTIYTLDAAGNRIAERVIDGNGGVISDSTLAYDDRDQLTGRRDPVADVHVDQTWDANGNLATQTVNGQPPRIYTYDARDRLVGLTLANSPNGPTTLRFAYHADGLRREKTDGVTTTHYQYDGQSLLAETNAIGNTLRQFHYSATQLIATTQTGTTPVHRHVLLDALRSPIALLDPTGLVTARTSYDAFGEIRAQLGANGTLTTPDRDAATAELVSTDNQPVGFTGYLKDTESGLYYAKARYYDPATARFTTEDPEAGKDLEPPSLHRYLYAYANPTTYTDRTGRCANVIMADDAFCRWMQYEQDALITGADLDTQEGIRSVSQYQIGKSEGHLSGTWSTLKDATQFLADIPGTLADFIPGVDFGSLGRMRGRATDAMVFVSSPISSAEQGLEQYNTAFHGATERGDWRGAGQLRGSVEGSIATGATLSAVTPPLIPKLPIMRRLADRGAAFVAIETTHGTTGLQLERRMELLAENDFVGPGSGRSGQRIEGRTHYRGTELTNERGAPIAEFDEIDIEKGVLYENKEALGFGTTGNGSESALIREISKYISKKSDRKSHRQDRRDNKGCQGTNQPRYARLTYRSEPGCHSGYPPDEVQIRRRSPCFDGYHGQAPS
ncbi:RHS repeat-associated core domain-containing protein [Tahibacter sp. UC22_41]|uniref:RHS repeat-associated core domain-containing protein n=1 Tax=Tahibacter sp. UC22_41 TaxID=3350178 RepID=UPI0036D91AE3